MKRLAYIFDIDGTLADCSHRLSHIQGDKKDWDKFYADCYKDAPIDGVCRVARELPRRVIYITGRPEKYRQQTMEWLRQNDLWWNASTTLIMRKDGDYRPDYIIKREIYEQQVREFYDIVGVFEDRKQCVDMWRSLGLTCFQVKDGDY